MENIFKNQKNSQDYGWKTWIWLPIILAIFMAVFFKIMNRAQNFNPSPVYGQRYMQKK